MSSTPLGSPKRTHASPRALYARGSLGSRLTASSGAAATASVASLAKPDSATRSARNKGRGQEIYPRHNAGVWAYGTLEVVNSGTTNILRYTAKPSQSSVTEKVEFTDQPPRRWLAHSVGVVPAYQMLGSTLASRLRTLETCHRPPRAVRTPRPLRAAAIPR